MSFAFEPCEIPDVVLVRGTRHADARGDLEETFRAEAFRAAGIDLNVVQENVARSGHGVLRGLHYQLPPAAQGKLVRALFGTVYDVAVDLRVGGPTYGRWVARTLDADTGHQLWIPPGFAHGYQVVSERAEVAYKLTAGFSPELGRGVRWDDPALAIPWPVADPVLSPRDSAQPSLADADNPFVAAIR